MEEEFDHSKVPLPFHILKICTAYESGFGKGIENRNFGNCYVKDTDEYYAYSHGYREGNNRYKRSMETVNIPKLTLISSEE